LKKKAVTAAEAVAAEAAAAEFTRHMSLSSISRKVLEIFCFVALLLGISGFTGSGVSRSVHRPRSAMDALKKDVDPNYTWEGVGGCDVCSGAYNKDPFGTEDGKSKPDEWEEFKKRVAALVAEEEALSGVNRTTSRDKVSSGRWPP